MLRLPRQALSPCLLLLALRAFASSCSPPPGKICWPLDGAPNVPGTTYGDSASPRQGGMHVGVDIFGAPDEPVSAVTSGAVTIFGDPIARRHGHAASIDAVKDGYIVIAHGGGEFWCQGHLRGFPNSLDGSTVSPGDRVGYISPYNPDFVHVHIQKCGSILCPDPHGNQGTGNPLFDFFPPPDTPALIIDEPVVVRDKSHSESYHLPPDDIWGDLDVFAVAHAYYGAAGSQVPGVKSIASTLEGPSPSTDDVIPLATLVDFTADATLPDDPKTAELIYRHLTLSSDEYILTNTCGTWAPGIANACENALHSRELKDGMYTFSIQAEALGPTLVSGWTEKTFLVNNFTPALDHDTVMNRPGFSGDSVS